MGNDEIRPKFVIAYCNGPDGRAEWSGLAWTLSSDNADAPNARDAKPRWRRIRICGGRFRPFVYASLWLSMTSNGRPVRRTQPMSQSASPSNVQSFLLTGLSAAPSFIALPTYRRS